MAISFLPLTLSLTFSKPLNSCLSRSHSHTPWLALLLLSVRPVGQFFGWLSLKNKEARVQKGQKVTSESR